MRTKEEAIQACRVSQPATYIVFFALRVHAINYSSGLDFFFSLLRPWMLLQIWYR